MSICSVIHCSIPPQGGRGTPHTLGFKATSERSHSPVWSKGGDWPELPSQAPLSLLSTALRLLWVGVSPNSEPTSSDVFSSLSRYHNYRSSTGRHHFHHIGTLFKMVPPHSPRLPDPQIKQSTLSPAKPSSGHIQLSSLPLQLIHFTAIVLTNQFDKNSPWQNALGYHRGKRSAPAKSWEPAELQLPSPQRKGGRK